MPTLTVIRGLPGSGKSTLAVNLKPDRIVEADNYLIDPDGEYRWTPERCKEAHRQAQRAVDIFARRELNIVVSNTFSQRWEVQGYTRLAPWHTVNTIDLFDAGLTDAELAARCVHDVPVEKIALMRARWERW